MKNILLGLVVIVIAFFGYNYLNSAKLPQECTDARNAYFATLDRLKSMNVDGSLTPNIERLTSLGKRLDDAIDPDKKYKRNKIDELRVMCIQNKILAENTLKQLDNLK